MSRNCRIALCVVVAAVPVLSSRVAAQRIPIRPGELSAPVARASAMARLATDVLARYPAADRDRVLDNRFRLELVAGQLDEAAKTVAALRARRERGRGAARELRALDIEDELYVAAARLRSRPGGAFDRSFAQAVHAAIDTLDDGTAALVERGLLVPAAVLQPDVDRAIAAQRGHDAIALDSALVLLRAYQIAESHHLFGFLVPALVDQDDARRYVIRRNMLVDAPDGARLCVMVVRPRRAPARLPAVLRFTIYGDSSADMREARLTASHEYASVTGYTRGKMCSPDQPWPYTHDADDAATVIDWIARQPWSDGQVGMYSGSYEGFTQWAAAKRMPRALKTIMVGAPAAPGIDVPMEGNIVWSFEYAWPFYTTDNRTLDNATYDDYKRWNALSRAWYLSGRAYRDLDAIDGTPNPIFREWLSHPSYDAYWQGMIPYRGDFARIDIPVLQTAGYYFGGPGAALYYFTQHYKYNPRARDYLVIGPYDHFQAQRGVVGAMGDTAIDFAGYRIDPVARIDFVSGLRYQWLDYVLKHGPRPSLLADKVNYEVTGANVWKHAPSVARMSNGVRRFYLSNARQAGVYRLRDRPDARPGVTLTVDLASRADVDRQAPGGGIVDVAVDTANGLEFVSAPLAGRPELSGLFSGRLDFVTNKKDFDLSIALFELTAAGKYVQIPPLQLRASYADDLSRRRLLTPGKREHLDFTSMRLASHRFEPGSRLVAVMSVIKNAGQQINYGSGKDVNDETIKDAGAPLSITWFADSYIDIPVARPR